MRERVITSLREENPLSNARSVGDLASWSPQCRFEGLQQLLSSTTLFPGWQASSRLRSSVLGHLDTLSTIVVTLLTSGSLFFPEHGEAGQPVHAPRWS